MVKVDFIKKLFMIEQRKEIVPAIELEDWLDEYKKKEFGNIYDNIDKKLEQIKQTINDIREELEILKSLELENKDISPREKHVMQGNRKSYILKTTHFLDSIELPEEEYEKILKFSKDFEKKLDQLNNQTRRSYYILRNFFDDNMTDIAEKLKSLSDNILRLREIVLTKEIRLINGLKSKIHELNDNIIRKNSVNKDILNKKKELEEIKGKKKSLEYKLESLKHSKEYRKFQKLNKQREIILKEISNTQKKVKNDFFRLQRPLKKFEKATGNDLIEKYLDDAPDELVRDKNFRIASILDNLRKAIKNETFKLKNPKKFLQELDKLNRESLERDRKSLISLSEEKKDINTRLEKITVTMDYKEVEYQLEHFEEKKKDAEKKLNELISLRDSLDISEKKENLENQIFEITGVKVIIEI
ncbi:hypothetical protein GF327_09325 [Candidatus Woesearchaeota archaeon]|nr:hypothetical protein [Candidatus Woesearchaeota archaeon]